jgi:hypothetical protein
LDARFYRLKVLELELCIDDIFISDRIHGAVHVYHVIVVEATEYVDDGVCLADICEKLISESFAFACAFDQSRNIYDFNGSWYHTALGFAEFAKFDKTLVGYGDHAYVRFNRAEWEVRRLCLGVAKAIEEGRFADIRQTHDSTL